MHKLLAVWCVSGPAFRASPHALARGRARILRGSPCYWCVPRSRALFLSLSARTYIYIYTYIYIHIYTYVYHTSSRSFALALFQVPGRSFKRLRRLGVRYRHPAALSSEKDAQGYDMYTGKACAGYAWRELHGRTLEGRERKTQGSHCF